MRFKMQCLLAFVLCVSLGACFASFRRSQKPQSQPAVSDLAGTYRLDEATVKTMREEGGYTEILETRLVLKPDGTAEMTNIPDWWGRFGGSNQGYFSGTGKWKIDREVGNGQWVLFLFMPNEYQFLELVGNKPPYQIFTFVGDPDSGLSMTLVKTKDMAN